MKNKQKRSEAMESDEKIVRVETLDDFDRELARDGGEALEVPASLAEQYGLFPEDVGSEVRDPGRLGGSARPRGGRPMKHDEYHRQFADRVIEQIRQGTAPWQKPWGPGERVLPANVDTGRSYSGGNSLHLAAVQQARGYADVRWGTYRQIQARGGQVRKGEQGTRILSFQDHRKIAVNDERGRPVRDNEGKRVYRHERMPTPVVRQYTVFNAEQADGLPARPTPAAEPLWKVHQQAERVLEDSGVPVRHVAGDRAFYNLNHDEIVLPERVQFPSANHYYQTALHELGHSIGPSRADEPRHAHPRDRRRVRLTGLCEGRAPRGDQRNDDRRARGGRPRPEPRGRLCRGVGRRPRGRSEGDPPRRGRRTEDLRLRAGPEPRARRPSGSPRPVAATRASRPAARRKAGAPTSGPDPELRPEPLRPRTEP